MRFLKRINYFGRFTTLFILISFSLSFLSLSVLYYEQSKLQKSLDIKESIGELSLKKEKSRDISLSIKNLLISASKNHFFLKYIEDPTDDNYKNAVESFRSIALSNKNIMQLRYLDVNGKEKIRLDRSSIGGDLKLIAKKELQDKSQRGYFIDAIKNDPSEVYVSNIDLNIEHQKIEVPYKPVVRFAICVYDKGIKKGIVIINMFMKEYLRSLVRSDMFNFYIFDQDNCILTSNDPKVDHWNRYLNTTCDVDKKKFIEYVQIFRKLNGEKLYIGVSALPNERMDLNDLGHVLLLLSLVLVPISFILAHFLSKIPQRLFNQLEEQQSLLIQQSKLAAMGEMMGSIAHQWRQPLNAVGVLAQEIQLKLKLGMLEREEADAITGEMQKNLDYMSNTIDDFRNFFSPSKEKQQFDILKTIDDSLHIVKKHIEEQNIDVSIDARILYKKIKKDQAYMINSFKNEFQQVMINIIHNAVDSIKVKTEKNDGLKGKIHIEIARKEKEFDIRIEDNGTGIKEDQLDKIFEPYVSTKEEQQGMGLGLYMSKLIIEKNMEGSLTAENVQNGARFNISLPIRHN